MKTPDITKVQGGAVGVYVGIVLAAPQAGYSGTHLDVLVVASAVVAATAVLSDALIRRARVGICQ